MRSRLLQHIVTEKDSIAKACAGIFGHGVDSNAQQIYRGARNTLYRVVSGDGNKLCVKHFRKAKFPNAYIYTTLRHSKARRSYEHAQQLLKEGFLTPAPIAWSERRRGLKLLESYYICEFLELPNIRNWGERTDAQALIDALGEYMLSLHRAGVFHRDFSPGNILVEKDEEGKYRFYLVDINRMSFGVTNRKKLMSMFRSISLEQKDTERLARAYAKAAHVEQETIVKEAVDSLNNYLATKRRHRFWKNLLRKKK